MTNDIKPQGFPPGVLLFLLTALLRFGALPKWALFWICVAPRVYCSLDEQEAWDALVDEAVSRKLVVSSPAPETAEDRGVPAKTPLYRLAKAGAQMLADAGVKDILGRSPSGLRASDFHTSADWKHQAQTAGALARLAPLGFEYITDLEIKKVAKRLGDKLPDALVRKHDGDGRWTEIEVEFSKKTGGWATRQARQMAEALEQDLIIEDRWPVKDAWLITTTRPESPTPEYFSKKIAEYISRPVSLLVSVCEVDQDAMPLSGETRRMEIEPAPLHLEFPYGEDYFEKLKALGRAALPEQPVVARGKFGAVVLEVVITPPFEDSDSAPHYARLSTRDGQVITQFDLIGFSVCIDETRLGHLLAIRRWGDSEMAEGAEYVIARLVELGLVELIGEFLELQRWLRRDGRSVEEIAAAYRKSLIDQAA